MAMRALPEKCGHWEGKGLEPQLTGDLAVIQGVDVVHRPALAGKGHDALLRRVDSASRASALPAGARFFSGSGVENSVYKKGQVHC